LGVLILASGATTPESGPRFDWRARLDFSCCSPLLAGLRWQNEWHLLAVALPR
jgi:hypothetical protein